MLFTCIQEIELYMRSIIIFKLHKDATDTDTRVCAHMVHAAYRCYMTHWKSIRPTTSHTRAFFVRPQISVHQV